jgi:hypothetical protein
VCAGAGVRGRARLLFQWNKKKRERRFDKLHVIA